MHPRDRWNARYADQPGVGAPAAFVREVAELLAPGATVLDLAGGSGRHALWLATRRHPGTLIDISDVALATAARAARRSDVALECIERDVETEGLPPGRSWDLVLMHYYFDRAVARAAWDAVRPGGLLALAQPTVVNLERHGRPGRRFLLEPGELADLADRLVRTGSDREPAAEVMTCSEAWRDDGFHEGRLVVRRPAEGAHAGLVP